MKTVLLAALFSLGMPLGNALAQSAAPAAEEIEYKPPTRGAPARRVGGSSRGISKLPVIAVLVPEHAGLTLAEQPALYWFVSQATGVRIEITLIDAQGVKPIIETSVARAAPGIHRVNLADFNVRLKPDEEYQWSVALVPDEGQRSTDIMSQGTVKRIAPPADLAARLATLPKEAHAKVLASAGIWYDAFGALSEAVARAPADRALRASRAALLEQVGLSRAADYERRAQP